MAEWGFYHLTRTSPDAALPALLGRTLAAGERALVRLGSAARVEAVDAALWDSTDPPWLPHGSVRTGHAALQPIWLTDGEENPNGARYLFLLDGMAAPALQAPAHEVWTRVFDLFDGQTAAAVIAARLRWTAAADAGHALTYWQQGERGWVKR